MTVTPRISLVAWADRNPAWIFVAVPDERGRYLRTDKSVVLRACPMCHAIPGEPCKSGSGDGYSALTHVARRRGSRSQRVPDHPPMPDNTPDEWMEGAA